MPEDEQRPRRTGMTTHASGVLSGVVICIVAAPVAVIATIVLYPFWAWLEEVPGIEAIGQSGPAESYYL
jgi:hypothetical protein